MENNIKHPIQLFRLVEDGFIRNQLLKNFDKTYWEENADTQDGSLVYAIRNSFSWFDSFEGNDYWEIIIAEFALKSFFATENK